jgi:hypothetical protein
MSTQEGNKDIKKTSFFNLFKGNKANKEGSCCNMKIVPKEEAVKEQNKDCGCNNKDCC